MLAETTRSPFGDPVARALTESEERFHTLADNIPQLAWMADETGSIFWFNRRWYDYTGTTLDEMKGWGWRQVHHPADVDRVVDKIRRCFATGESWDDTFPLRGKDGTYRWFLSRAIPIRNESGQVVRWLGTNTDITEQRAAEEELRRHVTRLERAEGSRRESEARFRQLADVMPQLVWTARPDGLMDYHNQRVDELSGFARRDDGTFAWEGAVHAEDLESTLEAWRRAVRDASAYEITHRLKRVDGSTHWYLTRAIPIHDADGRVIQWFGSTTDVDVQKRTEEALREADRHKNEFLAMLSHDLRNPFTVFRNGLALLERAVSDNPQATRALGLLGRQVQQMGRLLDDLLDVTRLSTGKLSLKREPLELNAVVRAIGEDYVEVFERERIHFRVVVPEQRVPARGDGARLTQAIGNLLQNAAKFTPEGGRVTLSLRATDGTEALVDVTDTGAGVQRELLERLFDPLVQADRTLHQSRGGLGLGLAVVKGIVELHGGTVSAASGGPGRGSVFTIRLPLEQAAAPS